MKKVLLFLFIATFIIFTSQTCFAQNEEDEDIDTYFNEENTVEIEGYLQYNESRQTDEEDNAIELDTQGNVNKINFTNPKKVGPKSVSSTVKKPSFKPIDEFEVASKFSSQEYEIRPISTEFKQTVGRFSFGTSYDSYLDSASPSYVTKFFSKYDWKYAALGTSFSRSTNLNDTNFDSKISFIPELKLTKRLSLLDVMQTDINQINKKNEIVLRYKPHFKKYAEDVQFELGAGQSFYEDNYIKSSLRFSTSFKF